MLKHWMQARRFRGVQSVLTSCVLLSALAAAQDRMSPGKSTGTVTTEGNLIILTLNENALGKPHLFDLQIRTLRFRRQDTRYHAETPPET